MRSVLEEVLEERPAMVDAVDMIGADGSSGFSEVDIAHAASRIAAFLNIADATRPSKGLWPEAFAACVQASGDADLEVAVWVRYGWPLGIRHAIKPGGCLPRMAQDSAAIEASRACYRHLQEHRVPPGPHVNYTSFHEEQS